MPKDLPTPTDLRKAYDWVRAGCPAIMPKYSDTDPKEAFYILFDLLESLPSHFPIYAWGSPESKAFHEAEAKKLEKFKPVWHYLDLHKEAPWYSKAKDIWWEIEPTALTLGLGIPKLGVSADYSLLFMTWEIPSAFVSVRIADSSAVLDIEGPASFSGACFPETFVTLLYDLSTLKIFLEKFVQLPDFALESSENDKS